MTPEGIATIITAVTGLLGAIGALVIAIRTNNKADVNAAHIDNLKSTADTHTDQIQQIALATPAAPTLSITAGGGQTAPKGDDQ